MANENVAFESKRQVYHYEPPIQKEEAIPKQYFAGFWIRFLAYLVDLVVIAALKGIIINPIFRVSGMGMDDSFFTFYWGMTTIIFLAYFILLTKFSDKRLEKCYLVFA